MRDMTEEPESPPVVTTAAYRPMVVTVSAEIIKKDGTRIDLGVISTPKQEPE
jgi:hypothetical protein